MIALEETKPVAASIRYLARDSLHDIEKPYLLSLKLESDVPKTNTQVERHLVEIYNARDLSITPQQMFAAYGFAQLSLDCSMPYEDNTDPYKVESVLYPAYKDIVRALFPDAVKVEVLEHGIRKRHPEWPAKGRERYEYEDSQPSDYVHIDMTASSAAKCCIKKFGINPGNYRRFVVVNLWKPIRGPVFDSPLTLCDRRTVDYALHTTAMDLITEHYVNENTRVYHSDSHMWYYWHGLQENEVIAFMQADSEAKDCAGVPHTAFVHPHSAPNAQLRESIEARVYAFFD